MLSAYNIDDDDDDDDDDLPMRNMSMDLFIVCISLCSQKNYSDDIGTFRKCSLQNITGKE